MATKAQPGSYAEALALAQDLLRRGRLNDPDEHFPYKHEDVSAVVAANPPMGPGEDDDSFLAEDYMTQDIADASAAYVATQAAYLAEPGDATKADYERRTAELVEARRRHRVNRVGTTVGGILTGALRAKRAGEA